ncbi:MAG: hypothetical protein D6723_11915 [Acidobacteria bacterium]|nr:MAG: hypothetical protein D6723_11915 [Acidobacteriota bacterium]
MKPAPSSLASHTEGMKRARRSPVIFGDVHGLASHTEGMNIKPRISPMITERKNHLCPSVESVAIFEGACWKILAFFAPRRRFSKESSMAGPHRGDEN